VEPERLDAGTAHEDGARVFGVHLVEQCAGDDAWREPGAIKAMG